LKEQPLLNLLHRAPGVLRILALSALIVAFARPVGEDQSTLTGEGINIVFALDMSRSMNAVDMTPDEIDAYLERGETPPNRFEIARDVLLDFVRARKEDRIGLTIFGQEAFLKFPLTLDYPSVLASLNDLVLDDGSGDRSGRCANGCTIGGGGTAIGDALARGYRRLRRSAGRSRVIVLITDGKNEGGRIEPDTIANELARLPEGEGIQVYTILVGDPTLTHLPQTSLGGRRRYVKPPNIIATDPELLERIAEITGGEFWETPDSASFRKAFSDLEQTLFKDELPGARHKELFHLPLLLGMLLLLMEAALNTLVLRRFP
jgi:Ca-activated chloride channel family protein